MTTTEIKEFCPLVRTKCETFIVDFRGLLSRQKFVEAFQSLSHTRIKVSRSTLLTLSALTLIVFIALTLRLTPIRWGLELSEFDPYFQFQFTEKITKDGYFGWFDWTTQDSNRWYPLVKQVGPRAFPGLPLTAATLYHMISILGIPISLYHFCVLFPAIFGAIACIIIFFLGNDIGGKTVGLFAALFLALNASHLSRTSAGFFDDETVGIGGILLFAFLFLRAIDKERASKHSIIYAIASGLTVGYITSSWGAALYPIALTTLFVFVLVLVGRYSRRLLMSYSITFGLGLLIANNVPKLMRTQYLTNTAILPVLGVFGLLCLKEVLNSISTNRQKVILVAGFFAILFVGLITLSYLGYVGAIGGKFIRVLNPAQRGEEQIFLSVQEHRLTAWGSLYYDYGVGVLFFAIGFFFAVRDLTNRNIFIIIFGLTTLYFASTLVRLTILFAPACCILMAIGIVNLLRPFATLIKETPKIPSGKRYAIRHVGKEFSGTILILVFLLLTLTYAFPTPRMYSHAYSPSTILSGSLPIRPSDPVVEWVEMLNWMDNNLPEEAIICSWWDYGYWITVKGNRTSLADNATFNSTHIGLIGHVFMSNETEAVRLLKDHFNGPDGPPTHILVFTSFTSSGFDQGYGDEGKWRWMARIANQTVASGFYREWGDREQYNTFGNITEDNVWVWNDIGQNTTIYKLMQTGKQHVIPSLTAPELQYFEAAHFSPGASVATLGTQEGQTVNLHAVVCLYKVNYPDS